MPLETMARAAERLQSSGIFDYSSGLLPELGKSIHRVDMLGLLYKLRYGKFLDKRDRVTALFSLVPPEGRFPIEYSVHWAKMYKQLATFVLRTGTHDIKLQLLLRLFEFRIISDPTIDSLFPSWVPD